MIDVLRIEYDVEAPGKALSDFSTLDSDAFVREIKKRRPKASTLSPVALRALRDLHSTQTPLMLKTRAEMLDYERDISRAVHESYGLNAEDLIVLRDTAPPRMPPGW